MTEERNPNVTQEQTEEKALAVPHTPRTLDVYGSGPAIRQLAERIRMCLPGGNRLDLDEALAIAQLAVPYGLNPFNGEIWGIKDKSGRFLGAMVGIKGHRKAARRQADYWIEHILVSSQERRDLDIPDNAVAYKCLVYRTDLIRESAQVVKIMREAGMEDAAERYAYKPTMGIGYCRTDEATKMKTDQAARKRAEAEALKMAFDLPFSSLPGNGDRIGLADPEDIDGEWSVLPLPEDAEEWEIPLSDDERNRLEEPPPPANAKCPVCMATGSGHAPWCKEVDGQRVDTRQQGRGPARKAPANEPPPQSEARPLAPERIRDIARHKAGWDRDEDGQLTRRRVDGEPITKAQVRTVPGLLSAAVRKNGMTQALLDKARYDVMDFLFGVRSTNDLYKREASAMIAWLALSQENVKQINDYAAAEAAAIQNAVDAAQGQQELPLDIEEPPPPEEKDPEPEAGDDLPF